MVSTEQREGHVWIILSHVSAYLTQLNADEKCTRLRSLFQIVLRINLPQTMF